MSQLYIFNPDNDLALAYGGENYTAPPLIAKLRNDLQMLPLWYAGGDDLLLYTTNKTENREWVDTMSQLFNIKVDLVDDNMLPNYNGEFKVWGWSADMRKRLMDKGVDKALLPASKYIDKLRELSHRYISVIFHKRITELMGYSLSPAPIQISRLEQVIAFAKQYPACYIKAPWSSSGRGLFRVLDINAVEFKRWCSGIISRQGSIMCEVPLNSLGDFAMEFYCEGGASKFVGYSLFKNNKHSAFDFGYISSQDRLIERLLTIFPDRDCLKRIELVINQVVAETIAPYYTGYVGVDMMVYDNNGVKAINPAIEVNLRTTMGVVTTIIGEKLIAKGSEGIYKIEYLKDSQLDSLKEYSAKLNEQFPLVVENNRVKSGVLFLTPIYTNSQYCAYIKVVDTLELL